jgi:UDP-N-acetylmuramoylalanine--D-glutamate ligase
MTMDFSVSGQQVVVAGAGRSGDAAARLLRARGARVTLTDTSTAVPTADALRADGITVELGPHREALFASADLVVLSPGVPPGQAAIAAARDAGVPVIGEVELASRWLRGRVIAITGTKGKSTTTTLAARMLTEAGFTATAGGNLGHALSAQVGASTPETLHVVEVSSFQLEATDRFHPWVAVLLNLSADHLDRHGSQQAYGRAKGRVFANQTGDDWAVVNADDPAALALAREGLARRFDYALDTTLEDGVTVEDGHIVKRERGRAAPLLPLTSVRLPGRHLLGDVLAATAVGCVAGVPSEAMRRAVEGFGGLEHALELVAEHGGIRFVNDSKATNVVAARRAIESFDRGVVAILGGRFKGGDFADLRDALATRGEAVIAIGEASPAIHAALAGTVPVESAGSMADAVRRAAELAAPGGVVLLAPACASFDMFEDYAARGRAFTREVLAWRDRQTARRSAARPAGGGGRDDE